MCVLYVFRHYAHAADKIQILAVKGTHDKGEGNGLIQIKLILFHGLGSADVAADAALRVIDGYNRRVRAFKLGYMLRFVKRLRTVFDRLFGRCFTISLPLSQGIILLFFVRNAFFRQERRESAQKVYKLRFLRLPAFERRRR